MFAFMVGSIPAGGIIFLESKMTAKEIALKILSLPEEQQNVPLVFEYYDDFESSIPVAVEFERVQFYEVGFPIEGPQLHLEI